MENDVISWKQRVLEYVNDNPGIRVTARDICTDCEEIPPDLVKAIDELKKEGKIPPDPSDEINTKR